MDGADVTSSGRLFQTLGPAEANERSPTVTSRDERMSSRLEAGASRYKSRGPWRWMGYRCKGAGPIEVNSKLKFIS